MTTNSVSASAETSAKRRELHKVIYAVAGALGIWAGIEPVMHLLQLLKVVRKETTQKQTTSTTNAEEKVAAAVVVNEED